MSTTTLYVELIIIGAESVTWLLLFGILIDKQLSEWLLKLNTFSPLSILLLCTFYILGIITDRLTDLLFAKYERKVKVKYIDKNTITFLIWKKNDRTDYYNFSISKKRILRSSIFNIPLITISGTLLLFYTNASIPLIIFVCLVGISILVASIVLFRYTIENYYKYAKRYLGVKTHK